MFVVKYSNAGVRQWTRQLGTSGFETGMAVAADGSGNVYVTGFTDGNLDGNTLVGEGDMFLVKYDGEGMKQWTRQLGTLYQDDGEGVATDDDGNAYVTGATYGSLHGLPGAGTGEGDIYLVKYNGDGILQWIRQIDGASESEMGADVAADGTGNVYVTGVTGGGLDGGPGAGGTDIVIIKYDSEGIRQWTRQFGTTSFDDALGIATDGSGNVYLTGSTDGSLDGNPTPGHADILVVKYDGGGVMQWSRQLGTSADEFGSGVGTDGNGDAYVAGTTEGGLDGNRNAGSWDLFVLKLDSDGNQL